MRIRIARAGSGLDDLFASVVINPSLAGRFTLSSVQEYLVRRRIVAVAPEAGLDIHMKLATELCPVEQVKHSESCRSFSLGRKIWPSGRVEPGPHGVGQEGSEPNEPSISVERGHLDGRKPNSAKPERDANHVMPVPADWGPAQLTKKPIA